MIFYIVITLALGAVLLSQVLMYNKVKRIGKAIKKGNSVGDGRSDTEAGPDLDRVFDRVMWPQFEAIMAIYRILDHKVALPPTRRWAASPDFLLHLILHIRRSEPRTIVECGGGTSTVAMAAALRAFGQEGHIYTLENHPRSAQSVRTELKARDLERYVTVVDAPLRDRTYEGVEGKFSWYDFEDDDVPERIDMLVVDGPFGKLNDDARYPAGPELMARLDRGSHVFVDDAARPDEQKLPRLWRALFPDLGVRELQTEKGAFEMFFLDGKIDAYLPEELNSRSSPESL